MQRVNQILDIFEAFLREKNIYIGDMRREGDPDEARLFGDAYREMEQKIAACLGVSKKKYDIVLMTKPRDRGLTEKESQVLWEKLAENEAYPEELCTRDGDTFFLGFVGKTASAVYYYNRDKIYEYLEVIRKEVEDTDHTEYKYGKLSIYISK